MTLKYCFETDDHGLAMKIMALVGGGVVANAQMTLPAAPGVHIGQPAAPVYTPPSAAAAPTPSYTPPPAAAAPAPPPPAIGAQAHDDHDKATLAAGWSHDMIKQAATAYMQKYPDRGAAGVQAVVQKYGANRVTELAPKHIPAVHQELSS